MENNKVIEGDNDQVLKENTDQKNTPINFIYALLLILALIFLAILVFFSKNASHKLTSEIEPPVAVKNSPEPPKLTPLPSPPGDVKIISLTPLTEAETTGWNSYSLPDAGFMFKYPGYIKMLSDPNQVNNDKNPSLYIRVDMVKISNIDQKFPYLFYGYNADLARTESEALKNKNLLRRNDGHFRTVDFESSNSLGIFQIENIIAKTSITLARFETCNLALERKLIFYHNDDQIILNIFPNLMLANKLADENRQYFEKQNSLYCWKDNFEKIIDDTAANRTSADLIKWYRSIEQVASTLNVY